MINSVLKCTLLTEWFCEIDIIVKMALYYLYS